MRNRLLAAAITGLAAAPAAAQTGPEVSWFGFAQIAAETTDEDETGDGGGVKFAADRIRIGNTARWGNGVHSKLQVDFNASGISTEEDDNGLLESASNTNQLPNIIKDAVVGYRVSDAVDLQAGMRKMPVGMDFNTSGKRLDIPKRSMEKDLVLERSAGAFLFGEAGDAGSQLGYALAVANPATRSGAVDPGAGECFIADAGAPGEVNEPGSPGEDNSYAGRLSYQAGQALYAEGYYGTSTTSCTAGNAEDYQVYGVGLRGQPTSRLTLKAEWIQGANVQHVDGRDRGVWYVHGGYMLNPGLEAVIRHYNSSYDGGSVDADLGETWFNANFFLAPEARHQARIQLSLVLPRGDTQASDYGGESPADFHRTALNLDKDEDAETTFLAQFQAGF